MSGRASYLAYRAGRRYRANRREVRVTGAAVAAITLAALSFALASGETVLSAVLTAGVILLCGGTTIVILMTGRAGRHRHGGMSDPGDRTVR